MTTTNASALVLALLGLVSTGCSSSDSGTPNTGGNVDSGASTMRASDSGSDGGHGGSTMPMNGMDSGTTGGEDAGMNMNGGGDAGGGGGDSGGGGGGKGFGQACSMATDCASGFCEMIQMQQVCTVQCSNTGMADQACTAAGSASGLCNMMGFCKL